MEWKQEIGKDREKKGRKALHHSILYFSKAEIHIELWWKSDNGSHKRNEIGFELSDNKSASELRKPERGAARKLFRKK